ncbi:uncharacterized protein LOC144102791 [Amblyomma americanum]
MIVLHYRNYGLSSIDEYNYRGSLCKFGVGLTLAFIGLTVCFSHLVAGVVCLSCGLVILAIPMQYLSRAKASPSSPTPFPSRSPLLEMRPPTDRPPPAATVPSPVEPPDRFLQVLSTPPEDDEDGGMYGDVGKVDSASLVHQYIDRVGSLSTEREPSWHSLYLSLSEDHDQTTAPAASGEELQTAAVS